MNMMKKLAMLGGALCAAGFMVAAPALAGVVGSRHDVTATTGNPYLGTLGALAHFGTCSACHIPHGAGADKLFPKATTGGLGGYYGNLCGSCHDSSAFAGGTNTEVNNTVFNSSAHGLVNTATQLGGDDATVSASGLPYVAGEHTANRIECLSCHDVHNQNGNRPFLVVNLFELCQKCHSNRVNNAAATTGWSNVSSSNSTHPSGPYFTGDMGTATGVVKTSNSSPLAMTTVANTDTAPVGSTWTDTVWNSGAHLEGAITGLTGTGVGCVTCHTVHWDEDAATPDNGSNYLGFVDDGGSGSTNNKFCEACHTGTGGVAGSYWNPGGTAYSHPNDNHAGTSLLVSDIGTFPIGPVTTSPRISTGNSSELFCTSCHGVHRSDTGTPQTQPNTPILLPFTAANICAECHSGTLPFNHHPIGGTYATLGNGIGGVTCNGGNLAPGVGTCHGGANNAGAHNRSTPLSAGLNTNYSSMCTNCHSCNPSTYTTGGTYVTNGTASHFVCGDAADTGVFTGTRTTGATGSGTTGAIVFAGDSTTWRGSSLASKFGANNTTIICESCHRLAKGNLLGGDDSTQLLVEVSGDGVTTGTANAVVQAADYTDNPYLCTGCHLIPSGTHPLADANKARYALGATAVSEAYAPTGLNCESCHSAHDANTSSGSFILDGTTVGGQTAYGANTNGMLVEPTINYTTFCAVCHSTFQ